MSSQEKRLRDLRKKLEKKGLRTTPKKDRLLLIPIQICVFLVGLLQFLGGLFVFISLLLGFNIESEIPLLYGNPTLVGLFNIALGILIMFLAIKGAITFGDT